MTSPHTPGDDAKQPVPVPESGKRKPSAFPPAREKLSLPEGVPEFWWVRHRGLLAAGEWILAGMLICAGLWGLRGLVFPARPAPDAKPTLEEFFRRLRELPAARPDPAWKAENLSGRWTSIVIHHTATAGGSVAAIDRFHREDRKWPNGMGYHFLVGNGNGMPDGFVEPGERWRRQLDGGHVGASKAEAYLNKSSIGIALVGNFESDVPTAGQLAALRGLLLYLIAECRIAPSAIVGHGSVPGRNTLCPGKFLPVPEVVSALGISR